MKLSLSARQKLKDLEGFRDYAYIPVKVTCGLSATDLLKA
jgi:hypothetical protein